MFTLFDLGQADDDLIFPNHQSRLAFMVRSERLARRWGVQVLAFRLESGRLRLLARGEDESLALWCRMAQSGQSAWAWHRGQRLLWRSRERRRLPDLSAALDAVAVLHADGLQDPLRNRWTSFWDGLGLRRCRWFCGDWLRARGRAELWRSAGRPGRPPPLNPMAPRWCPWDQVLAAVAASTGADPEGRLQRVLLFQLAGLCGWEEDALAATLRVGGPAVRKAWRQRGRPQLGAALAHLSEPALITAMADGPWWVERPLPPPRGPGAVAELRLLP